MSEILSSTNTVSTLYLFDKDTSTLWYILKGQGPWGELKVIAENKDKALRPLVKACRAGSKCVGDSSKCCTAQHKGQTIEETVKKWNQLITKSSTTPPNDRSKLPKTISARNIYWKLWYL